MNKKLLTPLLAIATSILLAPSASAQTAPTTGRDAKTPLVTEAQWKFNLTANVGYVYNFDSKYSLGYGGHLGWVNRSGFGISANYLGFASKLNNPFDFTNNYHVVTLAPSYRISFGENREWGLKLGLGMGVGFSLADAKSQGNPANATAVSGSRVAGGASYYSTAATGVLKAGATCGHPVGVSGVRMYADSKGYNGVNLAANQCEDVMTNPVAGLSDFDIAAFFTVGMGAKKPNGQVDGELTIGVSRTDSDAVSYGVWRRLFTTAPAINGEFRSPNFYVFETRNAYVARCGEYVASQADTGGAESTCRAGSIASASASASAGKAKDYAGFVLAPEIAIEYDNGLFHADINARYIHKLFNIKYDGQKGITHDWQKMGSLAVFIGAGLGLNF